MVDVELFQTGQVHQTKVIQLLNVVLLQVESHQPAQRRQTHRAYLSRERKTPFSSWSPTFVGYPGPGVTCVPVWSDSARGPALSGYWGSVAQWWWRRCCCAAAAAAETHFHTHNLITWLSVDDLPVQVMTFQYRSSTLKVWIIIESEHPLQHAISSRPEFQRRCFNVNRAHIAASRLSQDDTSSQCVCYIFKRHLCVGKCDHRSQTPPCSTIICNLLHSVQWLHWRRLLCSKCNHLLLRLCFSCQVSIYLS